MDFYVINILLFPWDQNYVTCNNKLYVTDKSIIIYLEGDKAKDRSGLINFCYKSYFVYKKSNTQNRCILNEHN